MLFLCQVVGLLSIQGGQGILRYNGEKIRRGKAPWDGLPVYWPSVGIVRKHMGSNA